MVISEEEGSEAGEVERKEVVVPGELLATKLYKPGLGAYSDNENIYAAVLGLKNIRANYVSVIPLGGRYIPKVGDPIIGRVTDISQSTWLIDINSPYPGLLHVAEVPWRVDFGETGKYLTIDDNILCSVLNVDEIKKVQVSMKSIGQKKLTGGQIIEIAPSRVPRVIGKGASMISLIKKYTKCKIFVGQNGRIWLEGDTDSINRSVIVIEKIEQEAHTTGLTERIQKILESYGSG